MPLLDDYPEDDMYDPFAAFDKVAKFSEHDGSIQLMVPGLASKQNPEEGAANEATRMMRIVTPSNSLKEGDSEKSHILPSDTAASLSTIEASRYVRVNGFKYCDMLNNATFDSLAHVYVWGTTVARRDPLVEEFVQLIDSESRRMSNMLYDNYPATLNSKDVKRFTCYAVADGSNSMANLTDTQLLHQIDSHQYISPIIPAISPSPSRIPGSRRKYKIAFLLMAHGKMANLENIINLLNVLDDGSAIILIHVDLKANDLYEQVSRHVADREAKMNAKLRPNKPPQMGNIFMAQTRFHGYWGHISLVWMQLSGFWELLDLADWENIINLSAADYPLRYSRDMHTMLSSPAYKGRDFVERWEDNSESATRMTRPHIPRLGTSRDGISLFHPRESGVTFPPFPRWKICKHHQWMILTPDFVKFLRSSNDALMALAFMEHTWIPDETYFCFVLINTPKYGHKSVNGNKRFLKFNLGSMHPMTLDITSTGLIGLDGVGQEPQYLLIRKVEPRTVKGRKLLAWIHREHIEKHSARANGTVEALEGEQWVDLEANANGITALLEKAASEKTGSGVLGLPVDPPSNVPAELKDNQAAPPDFKPPALPAQKAVPKGAKDRSEQKIAEEVDGEEEELIEDGKQERQRQMEQDHLFEKDQKGKNVEVEGDMR
ncbi:hypothetical protein HDU67_009919 [Dinochytrium kinnereticum]|nr:hypothetical protein HDU67_009919 [Dinochytrium kinnereticum]